MEEEMFLDTIHHVALIVSDYDKSREFYVKQLGFEVIRENNRTDRQDIKLDLRCGAIELEIFGKQVNHPNYIAPPQRPSYPEACGLRHLAFKVDNIEAVVAELAEKGIPCQPIRRDTFTGEKMTFFFDPDGLPLELHE